MSEKLVGAGFVLLFSALGWMTLAFLVWASIELVGGDTGWMGFDYDGRSMIGPWPMRVMAALAVVGFWCFVSAGVLVLIQQWRDRP